MSAQPAHSLAWYDERRTFIGGSDAPVIVRVDPWTSPFELWLEKTGQVTGERSDSALTRWGRRVEDAVAAEYTDETGRKLRRSPLRRMPGTPFLACHPDRIVEGERRLIEIKSSWRAWDEVPERVMVQVQHSLGVVGYEVADVVLATGFAGFRIYEIPRNDVMIANLVKVERAWWERHVIGGVEPERTGRYLDQVRGDDVMIASDLQAQYVRTLRDVRERKGQLEATEDNVVEWLKQSMAGANRLDGRDYGFSISWKPGKDSTKTDWRLVASAYREMALGNNRRCAEFMCGHFASRHVPNGGEHPCRDCVSCKGFVPGAMTTPLPDELDAIESLYTETKAGTRPFRVTFKDTEPTGSEEE